jgi:hypothetical protein
MFVVFTSREVGNEMSGVTPYITLEKIAGRLKDLDTRDSVNEALDEVEFLFEVIPPELQGPAEDLIAQLRDKLKNLS